MKKQKLLFAAVLLFVSTLVWSQDVQLIAIHMGNPDNRTALDQTAFPGFSFYYNDAKLVRYTEEQKLMGNPVNLCGWYGEVPEKMGFCANYLKKDGVDNSGSYSQGVVFVIDQAGTIAYQSTPDRIINDGFSEVYANTQKEIQSAVKDCKKGKLAKKVKADKQVSLKSAPVGEIETVKKAETNKSGEGIVGWDVPELALTDENGQTISLKELTNNKISVVVFYTLNGIHWVKGNPKGEIVEEFDGEPVMSPAMASGKLQDKVMNADIATKGEAKKEFTKTMFKEAVGNSSSGLAKAAVLSKDERSEKESDNEKRENYNKYTQHLGMVAEIAPKLK